MENIQDSHRFVAYYRVSTREQANSGLGLEAQRTTVLNYIRHNGNKVIAEFTEVESGGNDHRPQLKRAIDKAKAENATLVIAKLDRLSRNLSFIVQLMDSRAKFVCCDIPEATDLTIHIFAALAQWERKRISERTREALEAKRRREPHWRPGRPQNLTPEARRKARENISRAAREDQAVRHAYHFILPRREQGQSYQSIADALNAEGYRTRRGSAFHPWQVYNIYKRFNTKSNEH